MKDYLSRFNEFNYWLAEKITKSVGTMTCAYLFAIIAIVAFPQAIHDSFANGFEPLPIITWISQAFLQLVLLAVILVGQDVVSRATEKRSVTQYNAVMETLTDMQLVLTNDLEELADLRQIADQLARIEALLTAKGKR